MSGARPAFAAGLHAARKSVRGQGAGKGKVAFVSRLTSSSVNRILKSSESIEAMVNELVGRMPSKDEAASKTASSPVDSKLFQNFIYGTICLNAITLGMQADYQNDGWNTVWLVCENVFTIVFTVEMAAKLYFLRLGYFWDADRKALQYWNLLDMVIAIMAIVDCWILSFQQDAETPLIRVMQLLRIVRIAKLLRLRKELVAIIEGLFSSLQCMVWIGFLLLIIIYAFSIVCRNVIGNIPNSDLGDMINNDMYFGTLPRTMLTLFNICLIDGWSTVVWPQMLYNPIMVVPMIIFMSVTCFGLMNALIGVIVERTTAAHQSMNEVQDEAVREMKMHMVAELLSAIDDSDEDSNGVINLQEFRQVQRKPHAAQIFAALNLPPGFEATDLFCLLDRDGDGALDRFEFLLGICRLIWCDEFQSQCLMNYGIAKVREDIRGLQGSLRELLEERKPSEASTGDPQAPEGETFKSMAAAMRKDYQEILDSRLEQYWQRARQAWPVHGGVSTAPDDATVQYRQEDAGTPEEAVRLLEASLQRVDCPELPALIALPPEAIEVVELQLEQLTAASDAARLMLRADGLLLVEGCSEAKRRVELLIQELTGKSTPSQPDAGHESGEETSSQTDRAAPAKVRRKRRARKVKAPEQSFSEAAVDT
ncbi:unnamed protein product [Effrenium voratum]|nr:unnamed protein product [Effrenium voratum]